VILAIPFVGHIIDLIKTPIGTILLLALAVWFLEASFKKDKKSNADQLEMLRNEIEKLKQEQSS
jgi:FtsZ-binding cell division protein ZapB